eukprot:2387866-Rhodomonas_salina.1
MSGTDMAYATSFLSPYVIPSTGIAYFPMLVRARYAVSGTDIACAAIALRDLRAEISSASRLYQVRMLLRDVRTDTAYAAILLPIKRGSSRATGSPIVLRGCYTMSGTDIAYAAARLCGCYAMSGTEIAYAATALLACCGDVPYYHSICCYCPTRDVRTKVGCGGTKGYGGTMPGTGDRFCGTKVGYSGTSIADLKKLAIVDKTSRYRFCLSPTVYLRYGVCCYAVGATDDVRGPPGQVAPYAIALRARYSMSGTDIAHAAITLYDEVCSIVIAYAAILFYALAMRRAVLASRAVHHCAVPCPGSNPPSPTPCPVLTYVIATRCPVLTYAQCPIPFAMRCPVLAYAMLFLPQCYAMSGTTLCCYHPAKRCP